MNETILIIGDSWAASGHLSPAHCNPIHQLDPSNPDESYNLDINFQLKGYEIVNKSWWGASNCSTLASALLYTKFRPKTLPKIKLIVFFFTVLLRDAVSNFNIAARTDLPREYDEMLELSYLDVKKYISLIREVCPDTPWAVIGGHAPLYKPHEWQWADYIKEDWRSELLGFKVPACHSLDFGWDWVEKNCDLDVRERELNLKLELLNATQNVPHLFSDEVHPNISCHHVLAQELINHFNL